MSIAKKYGIPEDTIKQMVTDGVISCSVKRHYEIFERFKELRSQFPVRTQSDIINQVAEEMRVSESSVDKIVFTLRKK